MPVYMEVEDPSQGGNPPVFITSYFVLIAFT